MTTSRVWLKRQPLKAEFIPFKLILRIQTRCHFPNFGVLKLVFDMIENQMSSSSKTLSKEEEFLICMMKLRTNIVYHLNVSVATVQRSFHNTLDVLYARLQFLVKWPSRENCKKSTLQCFRQDFGQKVVVILDWLKQKFVRSSCVPETWVTIGM